jgi:hypothetical protein
MTSAGIISGIGNFRNFHKKHEIHNVVIKEEDENHKSPFDN